MKNKLLKPGRPLLSILFILAAALAALTAKGDLTGAVNPNTGLPVTASTVSGPIDPNTGLPIAAPAFEWKDSAWKDPGIVMSNINWVGLPLSEIKNQMRDQFGDNFDIIFPGSILPPDSKAPIQTDALIMDLQLRNVTASEMFYAMNLQFEAQGLPVRWKLFLNGNRQTVILCAPTGLSSPVAVPATKRAVFFIGRLLNATNSANPADELAQMSDIAKTIATASSLGDSASDDFEISTVDNRVQVVWHSHPENHVSEQISIYPPAQLLIVKGSADQIEMVHQTLQAMEEKLGLQSAGLKAGADAGIR